jgi:hypothetical protein
LICCHRTQMSELWHMYRRIYYLLLYRGIAL